MTSALLLAAGKATRLGSIRDQYAKSCLPIGDTTPLRWAIEQLADAGVSRIVVNLHWQAEQVWQVAQQAASGRVEVVSLPEAKLLGTGGSLIASTELLGGLPDIVMNAKLFTDVNFGALLQAPAPCLVVHPASDVRVFGGLRYDNDGNLLGLRARTDPAGPNNASVYTGIARPSQAWLDCLIAARQAHESKSKTAPLLCLARDGFLPAQAAGHSIRIVEHPGYWFEMSTPKRLDAAREAYAAHHAAGN